jgi:hypothetical protein
LRAIRGVGENVTLFLVHPGTSARITVGSFDSAECPELEPLEQGLMSPPGKAMVETGGALPGQSEQLRLDSCRELWRRREAAKTSTDNYDSWHMIIHSFFSFRFLLMISPLELWEKERDPKAQLPIGGVVRLLHVPKGLQRCVNVQLANFE